MTNENDKCSLGGGTAKEIKQHGWRGGGLPPLPATSSASRQHAFRWMDARYVEHAPHALTPS